MERIADKNFSSERALYALTDAVVENCTFSGEEDGESALKESKRISVNNCTFELRYPFWHTSGFTVKNSRLSDTCRAPLWYSDKGSISDTFITGPKALRECNDIKLSGVSAVSAEFGWRCRRVMVEKCDFESEYIFFGGKKLTLENVKLKGKYSFQYVEGLYIKDSELDTKDSFWHAKNVTVENSVVKGEYLGWYSDRLTMRNCKIIGTQPFCYCKHLTLENCELVDCDLAFEYSDVKADVRGHIVSVKNPRSGYIKADSIGEIINGESVYKCRCKIKAK